MRTIVKILAGLTIISLPLIGRTMLAADAPSVMLSAAVAAPTGPSSAPPAPAAPAQPTEAPEAPEAPKVKVCGPRSKMPGQPPRTMRCDGAGELLSPVCRPCKGAAGKGKGKARKGVK
jgi:hypothetical protein